MPFTEFCCRAGGSNLNAGSRNGSSTEPGTSANFTYAGGAWIASTGVFTTASENPSTDGVAVGDFASVYTAGATVTGFVGRVTAVSATTITVSLLIKAGTAPVDGTYTVKIGGAWQGPNGAVAFPIGLIQSTLVNVTGYPPRINFKNDQTHAMTATTTQANNGPIAWQGYTSSYGDKGRTTFDGSAAGAAFTFITVSGQNNIFTDFIFNRNGTTGTGVVGVNITGAESIFARCIISNIRGTGYQSLSTVYECEAASCAGRGFNLSGVVPAVRCIAHHCTIEGFNAVAVCIDCISYKNTGAGFINANTTYAEYYNCDAYDNGSHGFSIANTAAHAINMENCNAVSNGGWGVAHVAASLHTGWTRNCGFSDNTLGELSYPVGCALVVENMISYGVGVTPWADPENGDFRIVHPLAKGQGTGSFAPVNGLTVGYRDIGAAQHRSPTMLPTFGIGI